MAEPKAYEPVTRGAIGAAYKLYSEDDCSLRRVGADSTRWDLVDAIFRGQGQAFGLHKHRTGRIGWVPRCHRWPQKSGSRSGTKLL